MGYIPLTLVQLRFTGSYPAERHSTDPWSRALVLFHIVFGCIVIYGGAGCWFAGRVLSWSVHQNVSNLIAISAVLHGCSNLGLLRKVPGFRLITVPFYIFVSFTNAYHGWSLLVNGGEEELLLVWNMVGTYIYVRYFVFLLGPLIGWKSWLDEEVYGVIYTLALPLAAIYGILLPLVAFGKSMAWAALFACPLVLGPVLLLAHRSLTALKGVKSSSSPGFASVVPEIGIDLLLQSTDPVRYHGMAETSS